MSCEITITLKSENRIYKKKFQCFNSFVLDRNDKLLRSYVSEAIRDFNEDPEKILLTARMILPTYEKADKEKV